MAKLSLIRKSTFFSVSVLLFFCITFYVWRFSPFLPHIDRNDDGTFTYDNVIYIDYIEPDFMEKFGHLERGKKIAIINKKGDQPWCTVYEAQGENSENVVIVFPEIIMSIDTYYVMK